jgi:hypothetical protein
MTTFKFNYLVVSLVPISLISTFFYTRILFASLLCLGLYTGVHSADKWNALKSPPFDKIFTLLYSIKEGGMTITTFHKNVTAGILSFIVFFLFSAITPSIMLGILCFLLSSIHALLRSKPPALSSSSSSSPSPPPSPKSKMMEERKATTIAAAQEEGEIIEDAVSDSMRMRGSAQKGGGAVPGTIRKKAE